MKEAWLDTCICKSPELICYFSGYAAHTQHAIGAQAMIFLEGDFMLGLVLRDGDVS